MRARRAVPWFLLALAAHGCARSPDSDGSARATHDALVEALLPSGVQAQASAAIRAGIWESVRESRELRDALRLVGSARGPDGVRFGDLSVPGRDRLLQDLLASDRIEDRRAAHALRMTLLAGIYGSPAGYALAGVPEPPSVRPDMERFLRARAPAFPECFLAYDATRRELRAGGGGLDDLVVGSGPAGAVLAHELGRAGRRVLVVEQGPFVLPGAADTRGVPRLQDSSGLRFSPDGGVLFRNARVLGGGTTVNVDLAFSPLLPPVRERIGSWRREGRIAPDRFMPADIERAYAWVRETIGTRQATEAEINRNNRVLWDGALRRGLAPCLYELNQAASQASSGPLDDKRSAVDRLLIPAMSAPRTPVALLPDARAIRIVFAEGEGDRLALGVEVEILSPAEVPGAVRDPMRFGIPAGTRVFVPARRVLVCAGALGSPALLLRSGLSSPRIGEGIVAHPSIPLIGVFDDAIDAAEGTPSTVYVDHFASSDGFLLESMAASPAYAAVMTPGSARDAEAAVARYRRLAGFGVMLVDTPHPGNRVAIDGDGNPQILYRLGEDDRRRFARGVAEGIRILFAVGAREVIVPTNEEGVPARGRFTDPSQADLAERGLSFVPFRTTVTSAHLQGSLAMGADPASGAVSWDQRVWGTRNVYAMDASVFPGSVGANPMQSVYVFAKLFSERLLAGP